MTAKKFDRVLWIFNHPNPSIIPSYVVGGIMPANILGIKKLIFLDSHDPQKTLSSFNPKILVISKAFNENINNLVNFAYEKIISDSNLLNYDYIADSFSIGFTKSVHLNK